MTPSSRARRTLSRTETVELWTCVAGRDGRVRTFTTMEPDIAGPAPQNPFEDSTDRRDLPSALTGVVLP